MNTQLTGIRGVPADVWERPRMREALAFRDIVAMCRELDRYGVSRRQIAKATGQSSDILEGRKVAAYPVLVRIADGLGIPRGHMGLADERIVVPRLADWSQGQEDEAVRRRDFLAHAASVTMAAESFGLWGADGKPSPVPVRINMTDVRQVEAATHALRALDEQYGHGFGREAVLQELAWAKELLQAEAAPPVTERLNEAIAKLQEQVDAQCDESGGHPETSTCESGPVPVAKAARSEPRSRRTAAQASQRAISLVSRVLPAVDRERYREECMSELDDLAQSSRPRWSQLAYVFGVISRAVALRFALAGSDAESRELAQ
ncbi:hypothetical protein [Amycolatopsis sp. NPDC049868]|uniref:hypothetical protein n=1 Tax=Amycolatopsis sp. NPDC049868 TaxID=3363934 RepID=UPI0037AAD587